MKVNVFGKMVEWQGKRFPAYNGRLITKDGIEVPVTIKFRQDAKSPDLSECPCQISFEKTDANLVIKTIKDSDGIPVTDDSGEVKTAKTLWIARWKMVGPYIDHSLDDFEDDF